jgi:hypothetical protein
MRTYRKPDIPLAVVFNHLETYGPFLGRGDPEHLFQNWGHHGDRSIFWLGDPKLVFASAPNPYASLLSERWGYQGTRLLAPQKPTYSISMDIMREPALLQALIAHAGEHKEIQLIPFVTSPEFLGVALKLRREYGLKILLPESPAPKDLWVRDHMDSKSGFRHLALQWLGEDCSIPPGVVCMDLNQAVPAVRSFLNRGKTVLVKADNGVTGMGHLKFKPADGRDDASIRKQLMADVFLGKDPIIVEEMIEAKYQLSPSSEVFVPQRGRGSPSLCYMSQQVLEGIGTFEGVLLSREFDQFPWYQKLVDCSLIIGQNLQEMGYAGTFDLDAVVDDHGKLFLLEVNTRRTGGTYVHELAEHLLGENFLDEYMLLSIHNLSSNGYTHLDPLMECLEDLLFPIHSEPRGVIISATSELYSGQFGCVFIGRSMKEILEYKQVVEERLTEKQVG